MKDILYNEKLFNINAKNKINGLELLDNIKDKTISTAFFDPQYRGVLDRLDYGNEGMGRGKARSELTQMSEDTIKQFIQKLDRVIKLSGHLFLWVDKYHLCTGVLSWFDNTGLKLVDMIVWDKGKIGMGYRTRRKSEYLIIFQKEPTKAKDCWKLHNIPDVWQEKVIKVHPHSKPIELQKQLILATTGKNDIVCDPASGGYSVLKACEEIGNRIFIGGDIEFGEEKM